MSNTVFGSYIGIYYRSLNFTTSQIGLFAALGSFVAFIAQPFWGIMSDRSTYKNKILYLCLIAATISIWFIPLSNQHMILLFLSLLLFYFFQCAISPISDAMTLELASENHFKFSHIRTLGSLGFAVMAAIAGKIFEKNINYMFPLFSVIMFISFLLALFYPKIEGHQSKGRKVNLLVLFKDKRLVLIYSYAFLISITFGFFDAFQSYYSQDIGISVAVIGLGVSIGSFSQFPFMLSFDYIYKKLGMQNLLVFSGIMHAIRWLIYAFYLTPVTLFIAWALHGCTFIIFYLCMAEYVNSTVVKELKASGQMMNALIISGVSRIIGSSLGGFVSGFIGIQGVFFISALICVVAAIALIIISKATHIFEENKPLGDQSA
jgi:PPP family 3-phenylpropionic acid transporter